MNLHELLCCPFCYSELTAGQSLLVCYTCRRNFPVKNNVPVFVDYETLPSHLRGQIRYFEDEEITASDEHYLEPWQRSYLERFLENMPSMEGKLVVDCGTGSAYMAIELAKRGAYVIPTDLSPRSVFRLERIANRLGLSDRILSVCATAESLPIRSGCASGFISNAVLEHIPDELYAIAEISRVTQADGALMLSVPLSYRYLNPLLLPLNYIHDKRIGHLRRYDLESIERKFTDWAVSRTYYTGHTRKVVQTIVNIIHPVYDNERIEAYDALRSADKRWASNIICFLRKGGGVDKRIHVA
ncbi:MAG: methyltransferase domain-containing protein [Alphaproteobacteria bacterium]|nr:methyltransferase domain-containing protein [Alphaproteobacteria bacterium]